MRPICEIIYKFAALYIFYVGLYILKAFRTFLQ